jgi:hypothetical protein
MLNEERADPSAERPPVRDGHAVTDPQALRQATGVDVAANERTRILADLANRFVYHAPKPGQVEQYQALRDMAHAFALLILESSPPTAGRERALAWTAIEQAVFWGNAGIARHG